MRNLQQNINTIVSCSKTEESLEANLKMLLQVCYEAIYIAQDVVSKSVNGHDEDDFSVELKRFQAIFGENKNMSVFDILTKVTRLIVQIQRIAKDNDIDLTQNNGQEEVSVNDDKISTLQAMVLRYNIKSTL